MRLVVFGVIGLVVGMGGGVGYSLTLGAPHEVPEGAEVVVDTAQVPVEQPDQEADPTDGSEAASADSSQTTDPIAASDSSESAPAPETRSQRIASELIRSSARDSAPAERPDPPPSDPAAADSTGGSPRDSVAEAASEPDDDPADDPVARAVAQAADMDLNALSTESEAGYRKVSRILAAMDADRAAQVLEGLQDSEVRQLIAFLPARTAAAILAELDPARVARLSRGMFQPTRSSS